MPKLLQLLIGVVVVLGLFGLVLLVVDRGARRTRRDAWQLALLIAPALILLVLGLGYPTLQTIYQSFFDRGGAWVGLDNFTVLLTSPDNQRLLVNTVLWIIIAPIVSTVLGLLYAVAIDGVKGESFAKMLVFLPMAISMVGASIVWKFVYDYRPDQAGIQQTGLLNQILVWLGLPPVQFIVTSPWNTLFLIVILIWIQVGFATVVLSAALKGVPHDIREAAMLDGAGRVAIFRNVTLPSIRPTLLVVFITITSIALRIFDIIRTTTGGRFDTSVVANEMYTQAFQFGETGRGAALAVALLILMIPLICFQVFQVRARSKS